MAQVPSNLTLSGIFAAIGSARKPFFREWKFAQAFNMAVMLGNRDAIKALAIDGNDTDVTVTILSVPTTNKAISNADKNAIVALCDAMSTVPDPVQSTVWTLSARPTVTLNDNGTSTYTIVMRSSLGAPDVTKVLAQTKMTRAQIDAYVISLSAELDERDVNKAAIEAP